MATLVAPLGNLSIEDTLSLCQDLRIESTPRHMVDLIKRAEKTRLIRHPGKYGYCLVCEDVDKKTARSVLEDLVLLLRLYKPGNVYYNYAVIDEYGWYGDPHRKEPVPVSQFAIFFFMGWRHGGLTATYSVTEEDVRPLASFVEHHRGKPLLQTRAYKFFFRGYHEPYAENRFLDNAIGLENILVNDTKEMSNIKYKFVDRGCFLLSKAVSPKQKAASFAKPLTAIYKERSSIVHSRKEKRDWESPESIELLQNSDKYLRTILGFILDKEELADSKKVDRLKRDCY
jgi:hypothetical protein